MEKKVTRCWVRNLFYFTGKERFCVRLEGSIATSCHSELIEIVEKTRRDIKTFDCSFFGNLKSRKKNLIDKLKKLPQKDGLLKP